MDDRATPELLVESLRTDASSFVTALRSADPDAPVPPCPGWRVRDLAGHLGVVHRWAAEVVRTGRNGDEGDPPDDATDLPDWCEAGAAALVGTLAAADLDAPCWGFGPPPRVAGFWLRRQAHETAMHRWDLGAAAGTPTVMDERLAEDGLDEVCTMFFPRQVRLGRTPPLADSLRLVSARTGRSWTLSGDGTAPGAGTADATLTGPPQPLLLALWHRLDLDSAGVQVDGDPAAARRVLGASITP